MATQNADFTKGKTLEARILIEKWSGDLHMDVQGSQEDQIKSFVAYLLRVPNGLVNIMAAIKLAGELVDDKNFMDGMEKNTKTNGTK